MWETILALISSLFNFGPRTSTRPAVITPAPKYTVQACYNPRPEISLNLKWPENFTNVTDNRSTLNPARFSQAPSTFTATKDTDNNGVPDCKEYVMNDSSSGIGSGLDRTYILVRENVRISSCKTDEFNGPLATGKCDREKDYTWPQSNHRGSCTIKQYPDLRKIAEVNQAGKILEIFWLPFSYNVGCDYAQNKNCGAGDRTNINLKDFVYVLKKRDAFDANTNPGCPALWDAGSTNEDACSHYFDVYLAEDVYEAMATMDTPTDPKDPNYFLKQVVENCKEQLKFIPAPEFDYSVPPNFISNPFVSFTESSNFPEGKINPSNSTEDDNYEYYIWGNTENINPDTTNLIILTELNTGINVCPLVRPTADPLSDDDTGSSCMDPIGKIAFEDNDGYMKVFTVYSQRSAPQTFFLKTESDPLVYAYTITEKDFPINQNQDPSLQLRSMKFITQNQWTWATPACKPAIYLYPEKEEELNIKLNITGELTKSIPQYPSTGWTVLAHPNGIISNLTNDKRLMTNDQFPYLFYEADVNGVSIPKEGWVFQNSEISYQLTVIMKEIGFNENEIADFLEYWVPALSEKPYYFVTLLPESQINEKEQLIFSKKPETLIRARFIFEGLDAPAFVSPLTNIPKHARTGFTVADWGGTLIGKSCEDIQVK